MINIGEPQQILAGTFQQRLLSNNVSFSTRDQPYFWRMLVSEFGQTLEVPAHLIDPDEGEEPTSARYAVGVLAATKRRTSKWSVFEPETPHVVVIVFFDEGSAASWTGKVWRSQAGADPQEFLQAVLTSLR